ncbi:MAG: HD domain-containing protein [Clostridia bacterium]|nr:HD domain-containing protein [Clostridia bacterium]
MDIKKFTDTLSLLEALKYRTRHSWTSTGRRESVAEHSWRLALMAYLVKDEFPDADINKVILMCLVHDIGEAVTGDIPAFYKTDADEVKEDAAVKSILSSLPSPYREELSDLFCEMNALSTTEAKIYKALDKMEVVLQHNEADISTWLPLEYTENIAYGEKEVAFSEFFTSLKASLNEASLKKIEEAKENSQCL